MSSNETNASLPAHLVQAISAARDAAELGQVLAGHFESQHDLIDARLHVRCTDVDHHEIALIPTTPDMGGQVVAAVKPPIILPLQLDSKVYGEITVKCRADAAPPAWMEGLATLVTLRLAILACVERRVCPLTGLITRQEHDRWLISETFNDKSLVYYGLLEIDRLTAIDSDYGYGAVETVLVETAQRLRRVLGKEALLARISDGGFAFAFEDQDIDHAVDALGPRILSEIAMPVRVGELSVTVTASLGLTRAPAETLRLDNLTKTAERALNEIKGQGGNGVMLAEATRNRMMDKTSIKIRDALDHGEITAFLQPVHYADTERLAGFEALTRWRRPNGDVIGPADYLGPIQRLGLTSKHCRCVIAAMMDFVDQCPKGTAGLHLGINAASYELSDPELVQDLCQWASSMRARGFIPVIEINEDMEVYAGEEGISGAIIRLAAAGAKISMDDFGTGAGSATRLLTIPAHQLKIDRRFVRIMHEDPHGLAVIRALLVLAEGFGMDTVAEGVETEADRIALNAMGCTMLQGFHYAPALPVERALELVDADRRACTARSAAMG